MNGIAHICQDANTINILMIQINRYKLLNIKIRFGLA
jgi:hypothetical protein